MNGVCILGASGHGKVVLGVLRSSQTAVLGFYDDDEELVGRAVSDTPVLGTVADFARRAGQAIVAIGDCMIRRQVVGICRDACWVEAIHATAWVDPTARIGQGSVICAGAVVQPDSNIGRHCIVNTGATIDHDCRVGDFVHVCPGANIGGGVTIGDGTWVGIGSVVIQGVRIGTNVMVGAGATVLRDIPDNAVVVGSPARIVRFQASC